MVKVGGKISSKMARRYQNHIRLICSIIAWACCAMWLSSCSTTAHLKRQEPRRHTTPTTTMKRSPITDQDRQRIAKVAQGALGRSSLKVGAKQFRADCSGTVRAIYARARVGLGGIFKNNSENDVKAIYRYVQKYGTIHKSKPSPGELVFFHNTYDRSRNGRMSDPLTHIGVVERVEGSTIHFIHHLGQSIIRSRMDLSSPKETFSAANNKRINDILRRPQGRHRAYTAGELFAGFGRL